MVAVALSAAGSAVPTVAADTGAWTLEAATRRVLEQAPERRAADAAVAGRVAELRAAGSWPNPNIELRADDKIGIEDGRGGTDLTRAGISQPLPLRRLARQRAAAEAALQGSEASRRLQQLQLEQETARVFVTLQLSTARLTLAEDRHKLAQEYTTNTTGRRDPLVRYLNPLERRRLAILQEEAQHEMQAAERERDKALAGFRALLGLPPEAVVTLAPITAPAAPAALEVLAPGLDAHPAVIAARQEVEAARAGIAVEESRRFADPAELGIFRERDYLNNARRDYTAVELSVQIPLWNLNRGPVDRAKAETVRAQANLAMLRRDADNRLQQSYIELTRLIQQAERMRTSLLEPAREMLTLTRRAFAAGEVNVLALVDANNTFFDSQTHYLDVLKDGALAASGLRLAAGQSIVSGEVTP